MPRLIVTAPAVAGLERCRRFLAARDRAASVRAAGVIRQVLGKLAEHPEMGRPFEDDHGLRELIIPFGASGYVALYNFDRAADAVLILAFRHQKEAGY